MLFGSFTNSTLRGLRLVFQVGVRTGRLLTRWSRSDGTATTETYTITVDGTDSYGPFPVGRTDVAFTGSIIRFDVDTSSGGNTGATEIEVFVAP